MEASQRRLRINFQDRGILSKTQKKNGLKHSWALLKPQFQTISDFVSYLLYSFDLFDSCPNGIILSMDGFALPPFESTAIFKDKDVISVKKKVSGLRDATKAIEETRTFVEDEIIEKQPLPSDVKLLAKDEFDKETGGYQSKTDEDDNEVEEPVRITRGGNLAFKKKKPLSSGFRLLANEEFEKETAGYQSETDKDEDLAEEPVQSACGGNVASKKRKASDNVESLKRKRRLLAVPHSTQKDVQCKAMKTPHKKEKLANGNKHDEAADISQNSKLISKSNELEEKKGEAVHASGVCDGAKKVSRSTRRKRMKRIWSRQGSKLNVDEVQDEKQLPVKDLSKDLGSKKDVGIHIEQLDEDDSDADGDLVPVEIHPGHIRFTPSGKANDVQKIHDQSAQKSAWEEHTAQKNDWDVTKTKGAKEPYCWNGITNKKKGQNWGKEKQPTPWKEHRDYNGHSSSSRAVTNLPTSSWKEPRNHNTWASRKQQGDNSSVDFEKLVPLTDLPEVGDVLAYRLLELSSSWCPELTSFRVGKILSFDKESNKVIVVPEPEYPLDLEKKACGDHDDDDDSGQPPLPTVYNEDGSLEIDFSSLVDVRILKRGDPSLSKATGAPATANGTSIPSGLSKSNKKVENKNDVPELNTPAAPGKEGRDVWEEISDAFASKKAQLSQEDRWSKKQTSSNRSWSYRTLRGSALGPTLAMLRAQNGA